MNCDTYAEWLSAQLDGELDAEHVRELNAHLATCEACQETQRIMRGLAADVQGLPRLAPTDRSTLAINVAIHQLAPKPRRMDFGPIMDIEELAEFLRVPLETVGHYLDDLPSFELGGKLLFRRSSVERWIEGREHRVQAAESDYLWVAEDPAISKLTETKGLRVSRRGSD
jgi:hypothetical protein